MGYKLELGAWSAVFAVPNALVDRYIKEADGDQLKVMLWFLRHNGRPYAAEDLAAALGITPQRVDRSDIFLDASVDHAVFCDIHRF